MIGFIDNQSAWAAVGVLILAYLVSGAIYRVYLHPLAAFPGPKLAALTWWYEGYFDVVKNGQYIFHIGTLHDKYGPIVRIGPNELHIRDAEFYDTLYSRSHKHDKYDQFYCMLGNPEATFGTIKHDVHKVRLAAAAPFFSAQAVAKLQHNMKSLIDKLTDRMRDCGRSDEPIPLFYSYRCLTVDIISGYIFGEPLGLLERQDWGRSFYSAWRSLWDIAPLIRQYPWMLDAMMSLPRWVTALINSKGLEVIDLFSAVDQETAKVLKADPKELKSSEPRGVMRQMSDSDTLPPQEKTLQRLSVEANSFIAAGFETTGAILSEATFWVLENPEVHRKLLVELEKAIPDPSKIPNWQTLEQLPYLGAVVRESLRWAVGPFSRLPRVDPHNVIRYKDWVIPANSAVGMSALFVARSPDIFPDPLAFKPERWLIKDLSERRKLERFILAFGKGTRQCVGMNLAYAELYTVLATIFRRFPNLEIFETTKEDMELVHDLFAGMVRDDSKALKVKVKNEVTTNGKA